MSKTKDVEWCVCGPGANQVQCLRCGAAESIPVPLSIEAFAAWGTYFQEKHRFCPPKEEEKEKESDGLGSC